MRWSRQGKSAAYGQKTPLTAVAVSQFKPIYIELSTALIMAGSAGIIGVMTTGGTHTVDIQSLSIEMKNPDKYYGEICYIISIGVAY